MFGRRRTPSARPSLLKFRIDRPIVRISSSLILYRVPRSGSFIMTRSWSHGFRRKRRHLVVQNPTILHGSAWSQTAAVTDILRRWKCDILKHPPYSPDMSAWYYDHFAQVKEPLRGTQYNTRDELIRTIERSIRNINKDGRADGVRRLKTFDKWGGRLYWRCVNAVHLCIKQWRLVADLIGCAHQYFNKLINPPKIIRLIYHHHHYHQSVLPKGRSFTANSGTKAAVLPIGRSSTANSRTKAVVLLDMNRWGSFPLLYV